jgi:hypothetical protein
MGERKIKVGKNYSGGVVMHGIHAFKIRSLSDHPAPRRNKAAYTERWKNQESFFRSL